jgi:hypothetical protein
VAVQVVHRHWFVYIALLLARCSSAGPFQFVREGEHHWVHKFDCAVVELHFDPETNVVEVHVTNVA